MAVRHVPSGNRREITLIHAWMPRGSRTVLWAQDMSTGRLLHLVQWGNELYLPVTDGLRLGIGVYNGNDTWRAYPTYVEGACLYDGGPSDPDTCSTDYMWEVPAYDKLVMDAIVNPHAQVGRPLVIVPHGQNFGIGEATFGTDEFRGLLRVYERTQSSPSGYAMRGGPTTRGGFATKGGGPVTRGGGFESFDGPPVTMGGGAMRGGPSIRSDHQVGIGAGAEEHRGHQETGISYRRDAKLVAGLRIESRRDLAEVLREARHSSTEWFWTPSGPRWYTSWSPQHRPTAAQVPVAPEPHRDYQGNHGTGA